MILLALETSYDICGAAVASSDGIIALKEEMAPRLHNERLAMLVEAAMNAANLAFNDLDAVAITHRVAVRALRPNAIAKITSS